MSVGLLILRVIVGALFIGHGTQKLFGWFGGHGLKGTGGFFASLGFAFVEPFLFIGYLISIAVFGLYQAIFMANAGGAWDNAKKIVEVELKAKGTPLHAATVVGDTSATPSRTPRRWR